MGLSPNKSTFKVGQKLQLRHFAAKNVSRKIMPALLPGPQQNVGNAGFSSTQSQRPFASTSFNEPGKF